jgi:hypothetical protein
VKILKLFAVVGALGSLASVGMIPRAAIAQSTLQTSAQTSPPPNAHTVCWAAARDIAALSPRARLADISLRGNGARIVMADAAGCALYPWQLIGALADNQSVSVNVSIQPITVRGSFIGGLADARDNGPVWTGRGFNAFTRTGVSADVGILHLLAAPQVWYAENREYQTFASGNATRSAFASPWYDPPFSIDLPSRFGTTAVKQIDPGESAAWVELGPVDLGASTSTQQWGPGERGNLILGPDAPGIPRVFVRTSRPLRTLAGNFSLTAFTGNLTDSRFFSLDSANELRTLNAINVAWSPSDSSSFTLGAAYASMRRGARFGATPAQPLRGPSDAIGEMYLQFRDPATGVRAWAELGRAEGLPNLRRLFTVPYQGLVYVVGADRAVIRGRNVVLVSLEAANLEQPADVRGSATQDFYTSSDIPQGWTQRGQMLGYPTGPGSQTQWLSTDWITPTWSIGVFGERVRWNEDAFLRQYLPYPNRHDVTMRGGVRGGIVVFDTELALEASIGHRLNYLFQNATYIPGYRTVDVSVPQLKFSLTPAAHGRP